MPGATSPSLIPARLARLPLSELARGLVVAEADTRRSRALGLAGLPLLPPEVGLLIPGCRSVHTFGMRFAIDLLFLDAKGRLLQVRPSLAPLRLAHCRRAAAVLEVAAGAAECFARETPLRCAARISP